MKKFILTAFIVSSALTAVAQTTEPEATYLFDFGGQGSRGTLTTETGWNNITTVAEADQSIARYTSYTNFVDAKGAAAPASMKLTLLTAWGANSAGGLTTPKSELLGDLAVANATCDYIFNTNNTENGRAFVISGLNPDKSYRFTIFGTRSASDVRAGNYIITGLNSWFTNMQVAGSGLGHDGENQRTSDAPVSELIRPDGAGNITLWIDNNTGTYVPLSCMKVEQFNEVPSLKGNVARKFMLDFGSNVSGRGATTDEPGWNNILNNSGNDCTAGTEFTQLVDAAGTKTDVSLKVNTKYTTNGQSSGGGLTSPDATALGDMGLVNATCDYFFVDQSDKAGGSMTFSGLDPKAAYRFYFFGSRKAADVRGGEFRLEGMSEWRGSHIAAGTAFDGATSSQNEKSILVSDPVYPTLDGKVTFSMVNPWGVYLPVNVVKIEEVNGLVRPASYVSAKISGNGIAAGEATDMVSRGKNSFEIYIKTAAGDYDITATDEDGNTAEIKAQGLTEGINRVNVDLNSGAVTVTPVTYFCVTGSSVGGWNTTGQEMAYTGSGCFNFKGELKGYDTSSDSGRVNFIMNKDWGNTFKRVAGSRSELTASGGQDIPLNPGTYDITVDLNNMTWAIENGLDELDVNRVTAMGSSVCNGQGATNNEGYAFMYDNMLADRYQSGVSENPFYISSIAIGGNSSVNLLDRFDDLEREYGRWVIYGISLGNEGIHGAADQEKIYNQFRDNMLILISKARDLGKEVIVMNNYTRGDFVASDYDAVKRMNAEIARWDVPSINMLGAIDNGAGLWADNYQNGTDIYHPNTAGHQEFFYAMVPSMMDAMKAGKALTMDRTTNASYQLPEKTTVEFKPEGTVHSFTLALSASTTGDTRIATIAVDGSETPLTIDRKGNKIVATLPDATTLEAEATGNLDNIVLSQNYVRKYITLSVGENSAEATSQLAPVSFSIGDANADTGMTLGELMFYRSSMHDASPFTADGKLNKSSLDLYVPMSETPENLAMSTLPVMLVENNESGIDAPVSTGALKVSSDRSGVISVDAPVATKVTVATPSGVVVASTEVCGNRDFSGLISGIYLVNNYKIAVR